MDYHAVTKMTATQLREELAKDPANTGLTAMKKDKLVELYCKQHGIDRHVHAEVAIDKKSIKLQIRALKKERDAAMQAHDKPKLAELRHKIHKQRHLLRRAVKQAEIAATRKS